MRFGAVIGLVMAALSLPGITVFAPARAAEPPVVQAVRVGAQGDSTRIVTELSGPATPQLSLLARPGRVIVSLPEARFGPSLQSNGGNGIVLRVRYGTGAAGAVIILDTRAPVQVANVFTIPPKDGLAGYRLVIDLAPAGKKAKPLVQTARKQAAPQRKGAAPAPSTAAMQASVRPLRPPREGRLVAPAELRNPADMPPSSSRKAATERPSPPTIRPTLVADMGGAAQALRPRPGRSAPPPLSARHRPLIVIDAGHGGVDPGAIGRQGEYEKTIVLAVAHALRRELESTGRFQVLMTRKTDVFIPLGERVKIARRARADLFLSIHADTIGDSGTRGAGVYTLSAEASDSQAAALAAKENRSDLIAGVDLSDQTDEVTSILIDFAQHHTQERSMRLAELLVPQIQRAIPVRQRTHRSAGFRVLKAVDVPSALVEIGYLSNPADEKIMTSAEGRAGLARALRAGIEDYFGADS